MSRLRDILAVEQKTLRNVQGIPVLPKHLLRGTPMQDSILVLVEKRINEPGALDGEEGE